MPPENESQQSPAAEAQTPPTPESPAKPPAKPAENQAESQDKSKSSDSAPAPTTVEKGEADKGFAETLSNMLAEIETLKAQVSEAKKGSSQAEAEVKKIKAQQKADALADLHRPEYASLAPDVDLSTDEGRAKLDSWKRENPHLFRSRAPQAQEIQVPQPTNRNPVMKGFDWAGLASAIRDKVSR